MTTPLMFLADAFPGPAAGTEGQLLLLIGRLDRSRYVPEITLLRTTDYVEHVGMPCPCSVLGIDHLARPAAVLRFVRFALGLRRRGFRLVHCFFNDVSIIAPLLLRLAGIRVIVSRRDLGFWYTRAQLAVLRLNAMFVDRYVANSRAVGEIVRARERAPRSRIVVIYNGITPSDAPGGSLPEPLARWPASCRVIGIVANLRPLKRIDALIAAFAEVRRRASDVKLVIVGGEPPGQLPSVRSALEDQARALGVVDDVVFTGALADPAACIARFDIAVLCSETEGFSNALIEYMRAARPVICTNVGGNPEVVEDGRNGFLVPVGNAGALAEQLVTLLENPALAKRIGQRARDTVHARFSDRRMASEQMACYDEVLGLSSNPFGAQRVRREC